MFNIKALAFVAGAFFVSANIAFAQTVTNADGVRTVIYKTGAKAKGQWSLSPKPLLQISGDDKVEILDIAGVVRQSNGTVVVASHKTTDLRFFSPDGKHVRTVGRQGNGPGEFDRLFHLFRIRDTLVGADRADVLQLFTPDGKYIRTEQRAKAGPLGEFVDRSGFLNDGSSILRMSPARDTTGPVKKMMNFTVLRSDAGTVTPVGRFPFYERVSMRSDPLASAKFGAVGSIAILSNGFCVGYSDMMALSCYDRNGKQLSRVERSGVLGRVVTDADKHAYIDAVTKANPGPQAVASLKSIRENTVYAERMPAFGRIVGTLSDEVWVAPVLREDESYSLNAVPENATVWSVFSSNGDWLSDITLPQRFRLMEAGARYVAGVLKDADDVETVVVYSIAKR
ncbi:MAG: 6-bladed beta-propeller [Gemmatimonas sp.]